ncbi:hypothetical protein CDAR_422941 [Caerostris darwini]|uniref:Ribosomal protein L2 n=1 Tax=Caerostris darwini TaxID=1538125 RepID=A0AAV4TE62_9ARAC|nr:hypothetical protein CDAR_422941 [Caerostris darwini]
MRGGGGPISNSGREGRKCLCSRRRGNEVDYHKIRATPVAIISHWGATTSLEMVVVTVGGEGDLHKRRWSSWRNSDRVVRTNSVSFEIRKLLKRFVVFQPLRVGTDIRRGVRGGGGGSYLRTQVWGWGRVGVKRKGLRSRSRGNEVAYHKIRATPVTILSHWGHHVVSSGGGYSWRRGGSSQKALRYSDRVVRTNSLPFEIRKLPKRIVVFQPLRVGKGDTG